MGRRRNGLAWVRLLAVGLVVASGMVVPATAQENATCLECHSDHDLTGERNGKEISVFVDSEVFGRSVHADLQCIACHSD
ncbi:MAG: hypothetical protein LJE95_05135, partial [Acidobacteria bacterium]|nr:hypothetical protein [Acidobacteriota bacterium]